MTRTTTEAPPSSRNQAVGAVYAQRKRKVDVKSGTIASTEWLAGSTSIELDFVDSNIRVGEKLTHVKGLDITYKRVGVDKL